MSMQNQIYTEAARMTKPTKAVAYATVRKMIEEMQDAGNVEQYHLATLAAFFLPPTPAKPKDTFAWIAKAVAGKNDIRDYLRYVRVQDGLACATDGHRLHRGAVTLADGWYDTQGNAIEDPGYTFPDVERVIPKGREPHAIDVSELAYTTLDNGTLVADFPDDGPRVNKKLLFDALSLLPRNMTTFTAEYDDNVSAILIPINGQVAVIMPMRKGGIN